MCVVFAGMFESLSGPGAIVGKRHYRNKAAPDCLAEGAITK